MQFIWWVKSWFGICNFEGVQTLVWFYGYSKTSKTRKRRKVYQLYAWNEIAFKNADYIGYATPHKEARAMLDEELTSDKTFYPNPDLTNTEVFKDLNNFYLRMIKLTEVKAN